MAIGTLSRLIDNSLTKIRSRYQLLAMDSHTEKVTKGDAIYNFRTYLEEFLAIFERHLGISESSWFDALKMRLAGTYASRERVCLAMDVPIETPTLTDYSTELQKRIQPAFERLQSMQRGLLQYSTEYSYSSSDSEEVFDWRFPPCYLSQKHPSVIFLSSPFYQYALCRTNPEYLPKDADHNLALRAADLLNSDLSNKGIRRKKIIAALSLLIPDNDGYCWATDEKIPSEHQAKFNLVYWRKADHYPAIIVELSDHMDLQPRSLARSKALYALSLEKFQHIQKECGAPALFLDFFNSRMTLAGAVCDSPFGMYTYQILPGTVDLRPNWPGCRGNRQDTVLSLLSLKKCVRALMELLDSCKGQVDQKFNTGMPAIGLDSSSITVTKVIKHGILFKVKLETDHHEIAQTLEAGGPGFSPDAAYVLKAIYGRRNTRYGTSVHKRLAAARLAPAFHYEFAPVDGMDLFGAGIKPDPLIRYCTFEYLPLPSIELPGWITLANLTLWPDVARRYKPLIHNTLLYILSLLEQAEMVHGDFRPNNILIKVEVGIGIDESHRPLPLHREDREDLLDIMVVDFDWSGKVGEVYYPYTRNERVSYWPGRDAGPIGPNDDRKMVEAWMKLWPETFGVESVPAVYDWL